MVAALRVFGRKELSQLSTFDVILILLISNAVQNAMVGRNTSLAGGLVAAVALFVLNYIFKKAAGNFSFFRKLLRDKPEILIHDGVPDFRTLSKLDISHDELKEAMREHGVEHYSDVKLAIFESDGNISIISGENHQMRQTHYKRRRNRKNVVSV
ncbi:DUF421 domain-containing protein [Flavobacterium sp. D33]|nr:YetF domain-containing protein [Flavobacterium selenitireducens]MBD3580932.1 DUF421 domain-containing protein [Flavobacterium selenitireducens]